MLLQLRRNFLIKIGLSPRITCARSYEIRSKHDIGLDHRTALRVGLGHHRRVGHCRMFDQTVLDFARPNAVTRRFEHIVGPAFVPKVAVGIRPRQVTGAAPVAREFPLSRCLVLPVAQKENRVRIAMHVVTVDGHIAGHAHRTFMAVVIDHGNLVPGVALAHASGPGRPEPVAVANDVVDFRLAKHFVDHDAQLVAAIVKHRVTDRLARTHQALQLKFEMRARLRIGLHHGFKRGREQKGMRHALVLHQTEGQLGAEASVESHDRPTEIKRRQ